MRVFVTGASGHIGSPVVRELLGAGHEVTGLARSDKSAAAITAAGAEAIRGDLDDTGLLREAAAGADGVIHLAFKHEAMQSGDYGSAIAAEMLAVDAFAEALAGSGKPLLITSGTLMLAGLGRTGTEDDVSSAGGRADAENAVIALADRGVRSSIVRLPPTVHSSLDHHGFIPTLIAIAREKGVAGYVGDGSNRWPAGHTLDAAHLYRLAIESAPAGTRLHAVGDEGIAFREIAEAIGRNLGVPVASVGPDEAAAHFGFLGALV
jgi:nucleoside-diphosphate-sugar epimerase